MENAHAKVGEGMKDRSGKRKRVKLTKREELLFRIVFALPYASRAGLACTMDSSSVPIFCGKDHTFQEGYNR